MPIYRKFGKYNFKIISEFYCKELLICPFSYTLCFIIGHILNTNQEYLLL